MDIYKKSIASRLAEAGRLAEEVTRGDLDPIDGCMNIVRISSGIEPEGMQIYELWKGIVSQLMDEIPSEVEFLKADAAARARVLSEKATYRALFGEEIKRKCSAVIEICRNRGTNTD